jgi:hypothetical protein
MLKPDPSRGMVARDVFGYFFGALGFHSSGLADIRTFTAHASCFLVIAEYIE